MSEVRESASANEVTENSRKIHKLNKSIAEIKEKISNKYRKN